MKSAEEWVKQTLPFRDEWIKLVKQIQLDAMREGMRRSQKVIFETESPHNMDAQRIATSINDAIDSLTDQDIAATTGTTLAK